MPGFLIKQGNRGYIWVVLGYVLLWLGVTLALLFGYLNQHSVNEERVDRSRQINTYLKNQCRRDKRKDAVFIGILQRSIQSALRSDASRRRISDYVTKTHRDIDNIRAVDRDCVREIPPAVGKR